MAEERTTRLTMVARAAGFDESARSVDVLAQAEAKLAETTAQLEQVKLTGTVAEVGKLEEQQQALKNVITEFAPEQEKLRVSTELYGGLLSKIHPELGSFVTGMLRGVNVAGRMATQQLDLTSIFKTATEAIGKNAGALALLGAGGAVALGIAAITSAVRKMGEEWERANKTIEQQTKAVNDLRAAQGEQRGSIEALSDLRRGGGFTADQARRAQSMAELIGAQLGGPGGLEEGAINQAVAAFSGEFDKSQLIEAAFLIQTGALEVDPKARGSRNRRAFQRALSRNREAIETFRNREVVQRAELAQEAMKQAMAEMGATGELEAFVRQQLGPGVSEEEIAETLKKTRFEVAQHGFTIKRRTITVPARGDMPSREYTPEVDPDVARVINGIIQAMEQRPHPVTINYSENNRKMIGPDAASQAARRNNGEAMAEIYEMGFR